MNNIDARSRALRKTLAAIYAGLTMISLVAINFPATLVRAQEADLAPAVIETPTVVEEPVVETPAEPSAPTDVTPPAADETLAPQVLGVETEAVAPTGTVYVHKLVINDDEGTSTATNFTITVNDTEGHQLHGPLALEENGDPLHGKKTLTLPPGTYHIIEGSAPGYTTTYSEGENVAPHHEVCTVTVTADHVSYCNIVNDDVE
ncbi:MAG: hypothetical protein AAB901_01035, partial [Patescibacteria group bacterium]